MGAKCGQVMSAVCGPCEGTDIMVTGTCEILLEHV